jgi:hypothetical protein
MVRVPDSRRSDLFIRPIDRDVLAILCVAYGRYDLPDLSGVEIVVVEPGDPWSIVVIEHQRHRLDQRHGDVDLHRLAAIALLTTWM